MDKKTQKQYQGQQPDTVEKGCWLPGATEAEEREMGGILLVVLEYTSRLPTPTQVPCREKAALALESCGSDSTTLEAPHKMLSMLFQASETSLTLEELKEPISH